VTWCILHPLNASPIVWLLGNGVDVTARHCLQTLSPALIGSLAMMSMACLLEQSLPEPSSLAIRFAVEILGGVLALRCDRLRSLVDLVRSARG